MKVLLFTHISDVDGLNNVILAKKAFAEVKYILCEAAEIDNKIINGMDLFNLYDYIFVTDLCPSDKTLSLINSSDLKYLIITKDH